MQVGIALAPAKIAQPNDWKLRGSCAMRLEIALAWPRRMDISHAQSKTDLQTGVESALARPQYNKPRL